MTVVPVDPRWMWAQRELLAVRAQNHLHVFAPQVARDDAGRPLPLPLAHLAWVAHMDYCWTRGLHAGIFAPAGGAGVLVTLAAWLAGKSRDERIKVACADDAQARMRARAIRGIVTSPAFNKIFPGAFAPDAAWSERMVVEERRGRVVDPRVEVRGLSARAAGQVATVILFDDVVTPESYLTAERRQEHQRLVDDLWMAKLAPGGRVLWWARDRSPDDTSHVMRQRTDFCWLTQRQGDGGLEQEVHGAGEDYLAAVRASMLAMVAPG